MDKNLNGKLDISGEQSIIGIPNSILKNFELTPFHPTLEFLDQKLSKNPKNVVLLVIDGMGSMFLDLNLNEDSPFIVNRLGDLKTVFPATTVAATTSLKTGLYPVEHGLLGWSMYFKEVEDNIDVFPNTGSDGMVFEDYHVASRYLPFTDLVTLINSKKLEGLHEFNAMEISPFSDHKVKGIVELTGTIYKTITEPTNTRNFIYGYLPDLDTKMHHSGVNSKDAKRTLKRIQNEIMNLVNVSNDTLFIITADHGLLDTENVCIKDYPELTNLLKRPPSIEPRALAFYIKDNCGDEFEKLFKYYFGEDYLLYSKDEVIRSGIFGNGNENPRFKESIGDYLAIATGNKAIFNRREETLKLKGNHAGLTPFETIVPLIVFET
ncbi:MAG: alkaline phosphatase family protein [Clostridiaceae bacterium]